MDETEIRFLLNIKNNLEFQVASLEKEAEKLQKSIDSINQLISKGSFQTADALVDTESFIQNKPDLKMDNLSYTRKIFAANGEIIAFLRYEKNQIFIRFQKPTEIGFTAEKYIHDFVQPILVPLKKTESGLKPTLTKVKGNLEEYINTIVLENIKKFESFEFLVDQIQAYFGTQKI